MNIITAIGNPILNEKLKRKKSINVIGRDIQYQEGILEILEERDDINLLIISNILPGEYGFYNLINQIKKENEKLEVIVFLNEKCEDIENFLTSKNIYKIYYLNNYEFEDFLEIFCAEKEDILSRNN